MGRTICPYCDIEVSESAIEAEDGCCPECGAVVTVTSLFGEDHEEEEADVEEGDFKEEEEDLDYEDLEEDPDEEREEN